MATHAVLMVNPNRMRPPIAPIGLEYVASALSRAGYEPVLCDLTFAEDWRPALTDAVGGAAPAAVVLTVRNIDDAYFASQDFVLETTAEMVRHIGSLTDSPVILGGVGFSCAPREVLGFTGAAYGVEGDGEPAVPALVDRIVSGGDAAEVPGAVFRADGEAIEVTQREPYDLAAMPTPSRRFVDNRRYFQEGGQAGIETKRGCNGHCVYCMEPMAKGCPVRVRPPAGVVEEFQDLLDQGIDVLHLCDSEFNVPPDHARAVCEALAAGGLGQRLRWYTYASPSAFDLELAQAMARAGCVGINFGVDHSDGAMLRRLGRDHTADDVARAVRSCHEAGLTVMLDMLFGSPGETRESIAGAVEFVRDLAPDRVGLSCGVRIYPGTALAQMVRAQGPLSSNPHLHGTIAGNEDFLRPIYYVEAAIGEEIHAYVSSLIQGDPLFLHADPAELDGNYNYNDNSVLAQAIRDGERGAYWDILRRLAGRDGEPEGPG